MSRWGYAAAAHLLDRAGFSGTPAEVEALVPLGLGGAVDRLLEFGSAPDAAAPPSWARPDPTRPDRLAAMVQARPEERRQLQRMERQTQQDRLRDLQMWWLQRMVEGTRPLQEKLTLFWHGHFATSMQKVRDAYLMWQQNDLFRRHAAGNWRTILQEVTKDPAMLLWLDLARSNRRHPNENYAREFLELFTLGEGHYTEQDVTEAARAFTGISYDNRRQEFVYRALAHDEGQKRFLGRSGPLIARDIIDQVLEQPQAAQFLMAKLWAFFASDAPPASVIAELATEWRQSDWELRPVLRTLLRSEAFYAPGVVHQQVKSPVQFLVAAARHLERPLPPAAVTLASLRQMGQELFLPPNVKGWDGGIAWLSTNTLLARHNLAVRLIFGAGAQAHAAPARTPASLAAGAGARRRSAPVSPARLFDAGERTDGARLSAACERRFLHGRFSAHSSHWIRRFLESRPHLDEDGILQAVRLTLCTPEYQLT